MTAPPAPRDAVEALRASLLNLVNAAARHVSRGHDQFGELKTALADAKAALALTVAPIPMLLYCPQCGAQHVDAPEPELGWTNPPHRSHLCARCGCVWRPADVPTVGVAAITTRGSADTYQSGALPVPAPSGPGQATAGEVREVLAVADEALEASSRMAHHEIQDAAKAMRPIDGPTRVYNMVMTARARISAALAGPAEAERAVVAWCLTLICCGNQDHREFFDTWEEADKARERYCTGPGVGKGGHDRAGIITALRAMPAPDQREDGTR